MPLAKSMLALVIARLSADLLLKGNAMNPIKLVLSTAVLVNLAALTFTAQAVETDPIQVKYDTAMQRCKNAGDKKDLCEIQAKCNRDISTERAKLAKQKAKKKHENVEDQRENLYNAAKASCNAKGNSDLIDECLQEAKTKYGQ
jgi:hypothetical protein